LVYQSEKFQTKTVLALHSSLPSFSLLLLARFELKKSYNQTKQRLENGVCSSTWLYKHLHVTLPELQGNVMWCKWSRLSFCYIYIYMEREREREISIKFLFTFSRKSFYREELEWLLSYRCVYLWIKRLIGCYHGSHNDALFFVWYRSDWWRFSCKDHMLIIGRFHCLWRKLPQWIWEGVWKIIFF
jgi:hypothetical protein